MTGAQRGHQRRVVVVIEVRPIQCHDGLGALPHHIRHPQGKQAPHVHALVGQQPVHLLHPMLALLPPRHRQGLPYGVHREARGVDDAQRGQRERQHPLGVEVVSKETFEECNYLLFVDGWSTHFPSNAEDMTSCTKRPTSLPFPCLLNEGMPQERVRKLIALSRSCVLLRTGGRYFSILRSAILRYRWMHAN